MPPAFSAKKIAGRPAYKLARAGQAVELTPVEVTVHGARRSSLARSGDWRGCAWSCSSGFYVRTLAHDLGQRLGCGAHLAALRRTRAGSFTLDDAVPLEALEAEGAAARGAAHPDRAAAAAVSGA